MKADRETYSFYRTMLHRERYCCGKSSVCDVEVSWSYRL